MSGFHIKTGQVLICDFAGYVQPEIVKTRPVVVISRAATHGRGLCTVIPLSTTQPDKVMKWHVPIPALNIPDWETTDVRWAKCDMLYTVAQSRLQSPYIRSHGKRQYLVIKVKATELDAIYTGIRSYLPQPPTVTVSTASAESNSQKLPTGLEINAAALKAAATSGQALS